MASGEALPKPPAGVRAGGRRLWESVTSEYELAEHEALLLREACRTVDLLDSLDAAIRRDGALGPDGRAHPAAVEARQQRIALARILASLRLPAGDEDEGRPQRRVGVRGTYALGGGQGRPWVVA